MALFSSFCKHVQCSEERKFVRVTFWCLNRISPGFFPFFNFWHLKIIVIWNSSQFPFKVPFLQMFIIIKEIAPICLPSSSLKFYCDCFTWRRIKRRKLSTWHKIKGKFIAWMPTFLPKTNFRCVETRRVQDGHATAATLHDTLASQW